ncbi:MAG: hypothetical protein H0X28_00260 [Solirubrobacterales bacterium]|nr:hypothetical protein [Solirubrobacterales bacterium]
MGQLLSTTATAFGLDISSEIPLWFLAGPSPTPSGRTLAISTHFDQAASHWPPGAELICDERGPDGSVNFRIETRPEAGYLIYGPAYGAHLLAADGETLRCFPEGRPDGVWQRLLIAQVLPFAALLHGLEVFHASAVVHAGQAIALLGPSRAGKTTLALELCRAGASFLADDVLTLEARGGSLYALPGTPIAGVTRDHRDERDTAQDVVAVNDRERMVRVAGAAEPAPLNTLFFIDRRPDGPESPQFASGTDAQILLSATFNFVLATPERLSGLLEVCSLAARARVELISCGSATSAPELAGALLQRLSSSA